MLDWTKNLVRFSWAMSLFGARQLGSVLDPRQDRERAPDAAKAFDAVTGAMVDQFSENLRQAFAAGDKVQGEIVDLVFGLFGARPGAPTTGTAPPREPSTAGPGPAILDARSPAGEEVFITFSRGVARASPDRRYITLSTEIFDLDGTRDGQLEAVWQSLVPGVEQLLSRPAPPTGTMDAPVGPVPSWPVSANTIARWNYADCSSISAVGPAGWQLIPLTDGTLLLAGVTAQVISQGTGRLAGAHGLAQSLSAVRLGESADLLSARGRDTAAAVTLDTFKFVTATGPLPPLP